MSSPQLNFFYIDLSIQVGSPSTDSGIRWSTRSKFEMASF